MNSSDENNVENLAPGSAEALSPGVRLRRAREACDLSREEVASHLKLSTNKIEALEQGDVEKIAAPVFVAGYLRSYAKLVNLSGDEIVADFKALAAMETPSMDPASSPAANDYGQVGKASSLNMSLSGNRGLGVALMWGVVIVLLIIGVYVFLTSSNDMSLVENASTSNVATPDPVLPSSRKHPLLDVPRNEVASDKTVLTNVESLKVSPEKEKSHQKDVKANIPAPFTAPLEDAASESAQSIEVPVTKIPSAEFSELTLYFTEESWVEVNDATSKRLLYRLGKAGMSHTVAGVTPFNIRLGYVNGVSIMFNGESYDLSRFANRKSARFLIGEKGDRMSESQ